MDNSKWLKNYQEPTYTNWQLDSSSDKWDSNKLDVKQCIKDIRKKNEYMILGKGLVEVQEEKKYLESGSQ